MVDDTQYRPARARDFEQAASRVDASDIRPTATPAIPSTSYTSAPAYGTADDDVLRDDVARHGAVAPTPAATATTERVEERREVVGHGSRPFSIAAGFFGWAVASFFTLVLGTIALALLGAAAYDALDGGTTGVGAETFNTLTTGGLVALLVSLFLAYLLGGYVAGRIGLWHGTGHGVAVVAWSVLFTVLTLGLGAALGDRVASLNVVPAVDWSALTGPVIVGLVLTLATMLAGAVLGANLGTRPYGIDGARERGRTRSLRGRPL